MPSVAYPPIVRLERIFDEETSTGADLNTMTDAAAAWEADQLQNGIVRIVLGPGVGQERRIVSNTETTLTVARDWDIPPAASGYQLVLDGAWHRCVEVAQDPLNPSISIAAKVT